MSKNTVRANFENRINALTEKATKEHIKREQEKINGYSAIISSILEELENADSLLEPININISTEACQKAGFEFFSDLIEAISFVFDRKISITHNEKINEIHTFSVKVLPKVPI